MTRFIKISILIVLAALLALPISAQIPSGYVQTTATVPTLAGGTYGASWTNLSSSPQLGLLVLSQNNVAHDNHNLLVVGMSDEDMLFACERLRVAGGGMIAVAGGDVLGFVQRGRGGGQMGKDFHAAGV